MRIIRIRATLNILFVFVKNRPFRIQNIGPTAVSICAPWKGLR